MARSIDVQNSMAAKRKVSFFVFFSWIHLTSVTGHLISVNNSVNFVGTLRFQSEKKSFGRLVAYERT